MEDSNFYKELQEVINRHSIENDSNTPDYILAAYIIQCLDAFNNAIKSRNRHKGIEENKVEPINLTNKKPLSEI